jgi:hypothetical protein
MSFFIHPLTFGAEKSKSVFAVDPVRMEDVLRDQGIAISSRVTSPLG